MQSEIWASECDVRHVRDDDGGGGRHHGDARHVHDDGGGGHHGDGEPEHVLCGLYLLLIRWIEVGHATADQSCL